MGWLTISTFGWGTRRRDVLKQRRRRLHAASCLSECSGQTTSGLVNGSACPVELASSLSSAGSWPSGTRSFTAVGSSWCARAFRQPSGRGTLSHSARNQRTWVTTSLILAITSRLQPW